MLKRKKRSALLAAAALTVGSLFTSGTGVGYGGGCFNLASTAFMHSLVPCGIFDCSNGILGGAINLCQPGNNVLVGCP